jgi:hypothetical protein
MEPEVLYLSQGTSFQTGRERRWIIWMERNHGVTVGAALSRGFPDSSFIIADVLLHL